MKKKLREKMKSTSLGTLATLWFMFVWVGECGFVKRSGELWQMSRQEREEDSFLNYLPSRSKDDPTRSNNAQHHILLSSIGIELSRVSIGFFKVLLHIPEKKVV